MQIPYSHHLHSPETLNTRSRPRYDERGSVTPPPGGIKKLPPETQAAIPTGLHTQLIKKLSQSSKLGKVLKAVFSAQAPDEIKAEHKEIAAMALGRAVVDLRNYAPDLHNLQQYAIHSSPQKDPQTTLRIEKYIKKAAPVAQKWVKAHQTLFSEAPTPISARINHSWLSAKDRFEQEVRTHVLTWHETCFQGQNLPVSRQQVEAQIKALHAQLLETHSWAQQNPSLSSTIVRNAMEAPPPYQLYYQHRRLENVPSLDSTPGAPLIGGYFKANKKTNTPQLKATQIRTADGQVYELLNSLTPETRQQLATQHHMRPGTDKLILGQGGYGKVRLARHLESGELVAVKKFKQKNKQPKHYADTEIQQFQTLQQTSSSQEDKAPNDLLDRMLGFSHVFSTHKNGDKPKSYVFTPLANLGDGEKAGKRIQALQLRGRTEEAEQLFRRVATQYTAGVQALHAKGFHHRDIKLENFLHHRTDRGETIRLADFGVMRPAEWQYLYHGGTNRYLPPEAQGSQIETQYDAEKHDTFSLGLCLLELRIRAPSQHPEHESHLHLQYTDGSSKNVRLHFDEFSRCKGVPDALLQNLSPQHIDNTVALLLASNPASRISAAAAHEFLRSNIR